MANETVRVVLADDHAIMRGGLRRLLEAEAGCEVVAEAGTVDDTVRFVGAHKPDVLVLDLNMPDGTSLPAIPRLREVSPETRIVVLTMQIEPAFAREALRAGAVGYVLKEAADEELVAAINAAVEGRSFLNPEFAARVATAPPLESGPPDDLTEREAEVLTLIALGHTNSEIAEQLYLSIRTVETHRSHIQQKLRLSKRSELVRYALDKGLIESESAGA
jgi:two-component system, NarL family, response regulator NreC